MSRSRVRARIQSPNSTCTHGPKLISLLISARRSLEHEMPASLAALKALLTPNVRSETHYWLFCIPQLVWLFGPLPQSHLHTTGLSPSKLVLLWRQISRSRYCVSQFWFDGLLKQFVCAHYIDRTVCGQNLLYFLFVSRSFAARYKPAAEQAMKTLSIQCGLYLNTKYSISLGISSGLRVSSWVRPPLPFSSFTVKSE